PSAWEPSIATNSDSRVNFGLANDNTLRIGVSEFVMPEAARAEFRMSSSGKLSVWLNGKLVYRRSQTSSYATDSDKFEADLEAGLNRLVAEVSEAGSAEVHARFRRKSATERHERLSQLALSTHGNVDRGRDIFLNAEKSACL